MTCRGTCDSVCASEGDPAPDKHTTMQLITSVTHNTLSIGEAHHASKANCNALVQLAKGTEGTAIVIRSRYPNRRTRRYQFGYLRFGHTKPIWCGERDLPACPLSLVCDNGLALDEALCREIVAEVTDAANRTTALRQTR